MKEKWRREGLEWRGLMERLGREYCGMESGIERDEWRGILVGRGDSRRAYVLAFATFPENP